MKGRHLVGFLIAPMFPALLALLFAPFFGLEIVGPALTITAFYSYPIAAMIGVPMYLLVRRPETLSCLRAMGLGAVAGLVVPVLLSIAWLASSFDLRSLGSGLILVGYGLVLGGGAGVLFWLIAVRPTASAGAP